MTLVLDVGSGASLPDADTARRFVDAVRAVDSGRHKIVLKAQLFEDTPPNVPLGHDVFLALYRTGADAGYRVTASVFDTWSLLFLLEYNPCFVKISCRPDLYWLAGEVPRRVPVWVSMDIRRPSFPTADYTELLACVPVYPAALGDYSDAHEWTDTYSDHTVGWDLMRRDNPRVLEKHFRLPGTTGPDAGPWAVTPEQLKEIM